MGLFSLPEGWTPLAPLADEQKYPSADWYRDPAGTLMPKSQAALDALGIKDINGRPISIGEWAKGYTTNEGSGGQFSFATDYTHPLQTSRDQSLGSWGALGDMATTLALVGGPAAIGALAGGAGTVGAGAAGAGTVGAGAAGAGAAGAGTVGALGAGTVGAGALGAGALGAGTAGAAGTSLAPWILGGASLLGTGLIGYMQANAAEDAAQTQANAANQANQLQYQMFKEQQALMQPWVQSGQNNLARLNTAMQSGGSLDPSYRYSAADWQNSPEYAVYAGARDTAIRRSQENLLAQNAASGMYGSGNMANQLSQNISDQYAMYDPMSFSAAQASALGQRQNEYNQLAGLANPNGAQQVAQYAGQYGQNAGQNIVGAGNALTNGQMGQANAWGNALTSGMNQVSNAYGNYQGQQNMNALLAMLQQQQGGGVTQINPNGYQGMLPYSLGGNYSFTS